MASRGAQSDANWEQKSSKGSKNGGPRNRLKKGGFVEGWLGGYLVGQLTRAICPRVDIPHLGEIHIK